VAARGPQVYPSNLPNRASLHILVLFVVAALVALALPHSYPYKILVVRVTRNDLNTNLAKQKFQIIIYSKCANSKTVFDNNFILCQNIISCVFKRGSAWE